MKLDKIKLRGLLDDAYREDKILTDIQNVVFFPKGSISEGQRRQMTTLHNNIYAFEVNGDFDVCQSLAKNILGDKKFSEEVFGDRDRITSANSISLGRLLPQAMHHGFIDKKPNLDEMRKDIFSVSVNNSQHYLIMKEVTEDKRNIILKINLIL